MMFNKANQKREIMDNEEREPMDIERKLRKIVGKRIEERETASNSVTHQELYERLVEEAVLLISSQWERTARYTSNFKLDEPLKAQDVFFITKNGLRIFSEWGYEEINPKTKHCCFFDSFSFESMEEVEKYLEDVKSRLPKRTAIVCKERVPVMSGKFGPSLFYSFEINVLD